MKEILTIKLTPENKSLLVLICRKQGCSTKDLDVCFGEYIEQALKYFNEKYKDSIQFISNQNGGILSTLIKGTVIDAYIDAEGYNAIIKMASKFFAVNFVLNEYIKEHVKITENKDMEFKEVEKI
jgi:hypothetical protein